MVATAQALRVVFSSVWLPATVVIPASSILGLPTANKITDRVVVAGVAIEDYPSRHLCPPFS